MVLQWVLISKTLGLSKKRILTNPEQGSGVPMLRVIFKTNEKKKKKRRTLHRITGGRRGHWFSAKEEEHKFILQIKFESIREVYKKQQQPIFFEEEKKKERLEVQTPRRSIGGQHAWFASALRIRQFLLCRQSPKSSLKGLIRSVLNIDRSLLYYGRGLTVCTDSAVETAEKNKKKTPSDRGSAHKLLFFF